MFLSRGSRDCTNKLLNDHKKLKPFKETLSRPTLAQFQDRRKNARRVKVLKSSLGSSPDSWFAWFSDKNADSNKIFSLR